MRATRPLVLSLAFVFAHGLAACGGAPPPPAPPPASDTAAAPPKTEAPPPATSEPPKTEAPASEASKPLEAIPPTVKLIDAGTAPKTALRYKFKAGVTEYVEMDMKMSLALSMGGKAAPKADLPTMRTTMKIHAKEITPEGDLRCEFNTEKVDVLKDGPPDAKMHAALEKELGQIVGMHGTGRISSRGVLSESEFELPPGAGEKLRSQMGTMRDAIRQMYMPFPEEEVGKGAKWEVTSRIPLNGILLDSKALYTLTKVDKDGVQVDVDTVISAPPNQSMAVPGLPPGGSATLTSLAGRGSGKVSPLFAHLQASATNKVAMETAVSIAAQGESMQMTSTTDVLVTSRPVKAPAPPKK
jgi:hypothetical protein